MSERDMLDLWAARLSERRTIEEFLEWLSSKHGVHLGEWVTDNRMFPIAANPQDLLNEYHEIDYKRLEAQRRALLESLTHD
jgi:hypothetical protein